MKKKYYILVLTFSFLLAGPNSYGQCSDCGFFGRSYTAVLKFFTNLPTNVSNGASNAYYGVTSGAETVTTTIGSLFQRSGSQNSSSGSNNLTSQGVLYPNINSWGGIWGGESSYDDDYIDYSGGYTNDENYDDYNSPSESYFHTQLYNKANEEYLISLKNWYLDQDGDGYYSQTIVSITSPGIGWIDNLTTPPLDCNDNDKTLTDNCLQSVNINPQTDLNGLNVYLKILYDLGIDTQPEIDDWLVFVKNSMQKTWYKDIDGDGWFSGRVISINNPGPDWIEGEPIGGVDCDDTLPNGIYVQGDCAKITWVKDADGDHWVDSSANRQEYINWNPEPGYIKQSAMIDDYYWGDCNDNDATKTEVCDTIITPCGTRLNCGTGFVIKNCDCVLASADSEVDIDEENLSFDGFFSGTEVKIRSHTGTYVKPSELDPNSYEDKKALNRFAVYLVRHENLDGLNKGIKIGSKPDKVLSSESQALTHDKIIYFNTNGGYSKNLDNINNFRSILKHEILHVDDNAKQGFISNLSTHADVYINAAKHDTFKNSTINFQAETSASFVNYLLNMDRVSGKYDQNEIFAKIDEYNKNNGKVKIKYPLGMFSKGTLDLRIIVDGVYSDYITYTLITDEPQ